MHKNGNMILAMSGNTIGKIGVIASNYKDLLINQRVLIIKSNSSNLGYIYFTLRDPKIQNNILKLGANSAQPNISEDQLKAIKVIIPNKDVLKEYLLPLLINGQINVDDIEI